MTDLLTALAIIFVIAGPFLLLANRFDLPTVPALILAGLVAGLFIEEARVLELAQYGIALLVFTFGAGLQLSAVRTVLADSEIAALAQILVVGTLGLLAGVGLGIPVSEALYLGIAAAFSSTIVGTALLRRDIEKNLVRGRLAVTIQLVQDLVAILVVLVLGAEVFGTEAIATQLGYGVMLFVLALLVNRFLFGWLTRLAGESTELLIVGVVSLLAIFVGVADLLGVSLVVGSFAAGLAVEYDPAERLGLFNGLESIKDFFVAVFFVTIGALVTVPSASVFAIAGVLVLLTAILKPAVTTAVLLHQGYEPRSATLTSLSLDQTSEFALIIAIEALLLQMLSQSVFDAIILATAFTMITSSLSRQYDEQLYRLLADTGLLPVSHGKVDEWSSVPDDVEGHVIIAGYGRQGRRLARKCEQLEQPYVVVENDPALFDTVRRECAACVFGDVMEPYTWEKAAVESARIAISTVDSEPVSRRLLAFEFECDLILRTNDVSRAREFHEAGALFVSVSDLLAGEQLLEYIGTILAGELSPAELRADRMDDLEADPDDVDISHRSDGTLQ